MLKHVLNWIFSFVVEMLDRYQSNPGMDRWKVANKAILYLQGSKDYILAYKMPNHLKVVGYSNSDLARYVDPRKSIFG